MTTFVWTLAHFLFLTTVFGVPESEFYPFGLEHGDAAMEKNDDGSSPEVPISTMFPFFNHQHKSLWVNTNGIISLVNGVGTFTPRPFPITGARWIVPFWADIDTRINGTVFYRETTNETLQAQVTAEIKSSTFGGQLHKFKALWVFIATWKDVTFYGARDVGKEKRNTFQAVLATNGRHSFAVFNYAKIEWTTGTASGGNHSGLGGIPAQVGFNAGDGITYASINASLTPDILNVATMTNCEVEGKFIFRIDKEEAQGSGCNTNGYLTISPRFGSMLGGEEVFVSGPCFTKDPNKNDNHVVAKVTFTKGEHKETVRCRYASQFTTKCITPAMFVTGHVDVILQEEKNTLQTTRFKGHYSYENLARIGPRVRRAEPDQWTYKSYRIQQPVLRLNWDPSSARDDLKCEKVRLDVFKITEGGSTPKLTHVTLLTDPISALAGSHTVSQPFGKVQGVAAGVIRMSCESENAEENVLALWSDVHSLVWTSPVEIRHINTVCDEWISRDTSLGDTYTDHLGHCPCNIGQAILDITNFHSDPMCRRESAHLHNNCGDYPEAVHCVRTNTVPNVDGEYGGQHCCYGADGNLLEDYVNKGTRKRIAGRSSRFNYLGKEPHDKPGKYPFISNFLGDEIPYQYCCEYTLQYGESRRCRRYLQLRPALTDCTQYVPPRPARMAGDPHMVTLDGARYTFNGIGEYTVVETLDQSFAMQARTEQARDSNGQLQRASVFSAVVMKGNQTDCIQVQRNEITMSEILVNGEQQDFEYQPWQDFSGVSVLSINGSEVTVMFRELAIGVVMEITADMINIMFLGPNTMKNNTRGLLGTWNDNASDDLTFRNGTVLPLGLQSRQIHEFGENWRVERNSSLFTYGSAEGYSHFNSNPNFEPIFVEEVTSAENVTDEQRDICGNSTECLYDLLTTNNTAIAKSTRQTEEVFKAAVNTVQEVIVRCPSPPTLHHGVIEISGHKPGDVINYTCNADYLLEGPSSRVCSENGSWGETGDTFCKETVVVVTETPNPSGMPVISVVLIATSGAALCISLLTALVCVVCCRKKRGGNKGAKDSPDQSEGRDNPTYEMYDVREDQSGRWIEIPSVGYEYIHTRRDNSIADEQLPKSS